MLNILNSCLVNVGIVVVALRAQLKRNLIIPFHQHLLIGHSKIVIYFCFICAILILNLFISGTITEGVLGVMFFSILWRVLLVIILAKLILISKKNISNIIAIVLFITLLDLASLYNIAEAAKPLILFFIYICSTLVVISVWQNSFIGTKICIFQEINLFNNVIRFMFLLILVIPWLLFDKIFNPDLIFFTYIFTYWIAIWVFEIRRRAKNIIFYTTAILLFLLVILINFYVEIRTNFDLIGLFYLFSAYTEEDNGGSLIFLTKGLIFDCISGKTTLGECTWKMFGQPGSFFKNHVHSSVGNLIFTYQETLIPYILAKRLLDSANITGPFSAPFIQNHPAVMSHPMCAFEKDNEFLILQGTTKATVRKSAVSKFHHTGDLHGVVATIPLSDELMKEKPELCPDEASQNAVPGWVWTDDKQTAELFIKSAMDGKFGYYKKSYIKENSDALRVVSQEILNKSIFSEDETKISVWKVTVKKIKK